MSELLGTKIRSLQEGYKMCSRCIYDNSLPGIFFDGEGICNFCKMIDSLMEEYGTGQEKGEALLNQIVEEMKKSGRGKKYDCVIGVSGGTDSSFLLHWACEKGLRPLAVHYDNTFNTSIATQNIHNLTSALKVDLYTHIVNNEEIESIYRAFLLANVGEVDASTDIALAEIQYRAAAKYGLNYVLEGHSFVEEGITPIGKNYFDGKYISEIVKKFGQRKIDTFPNMPFWTFLKWIVYKRIRKIRPLWYIAYSKTEAKKLLADRYQWKDYGGHHLENRMTAFSHSIYYPKKFEIDYRNNSLSAQVRNGNLNRKEAVNRYYHENPFIEVGLEDYIKKRLGFDDDEFQKIMEAPPKYWYEYPTYKRRFELLRPFFYLLYLRNLVPKSFYLKYCFPVKVGK